jgi:branched-chain amino acid transport system permease protein
MKYLRDALRDALFAGGIALLLFVPLTGLVLEGYTVVTHWERPLWMAGVVAVGRLLSGLALATRRGRAWRERWRAPRARYPVSWHRGWLLGLLLLGSVILPFVLGKYGLNVAILALIYVLLGLGLNIVVGMAGLLDLGYVAFYAVGAYVCALGAQYLQLGFWEALPWAVLLSGLVGMLLAFPVLRMHGDYLAIVTLGFGEIIRLVLNNWTAFTGGPNGASAPFPTLFGLEFGRSSATGQPLFHEFFGLAYANTYRYIFIYLLLLACVTGVLALAVRLRAMPLGRFLEALREDEIACRALGVNPVMIKLAAFGLGAMVGGLGGSFFAASQGFINPASFTFFESALILAIVVLGGMGSVVGVVLSALVLTILPELLRDFADYRGLLFGFAMVLMMIWRPRGLLQDRRPVFDVARGESPS